MAKADACRKQTLKSESIETDADCRSMVFCTIERASSLLQEHARALQDCSARCAVAAWLSSSEAKRKSSSTS
jgi:hypothetical protein